MKRIIASCLVACTVSAVSASLPSMKTDTTFTAKANPFVTYKYLGDPAALVDGGKVYIYAGHDECPDHQNRYVMNEWCILSTSDMKTFTEHAYTLKATDFPWARGEAWAGQVIKRGDKYYWFVTAEHKSIRGKAIGVAVADSPEGPFIPQPEALITNDMTTKYTPIGWEDIDPTVMVDDDGQAYIFWGNTQLYYARLKENMKSIAACFFFDGIVNVIFLCHAQKVRNALDLHVFQLAGMLRKFFHGNSAFSLRLSGKKVLHG